MPPTRGDQRHYRAGRESDTDDQTHGHTGASPRVSKTRMTPKPHPAMLVMCQAKRSVFLTNARSLVLRT